jgi:hypothetical protein
MTHNQLEAVAYHEAGHAVVAFFLFTGIRKKGASIVADEETAGRVHMRTTFNGDPNRLKYESSLRFRDGLEKAAMRSLAGEIAQRRFRPSSVRRHHAASDRETVMDCLAHLSECDEELMRAYLKLLTIRTRNMVAFYWPEITAVAEALTEKKVLSAEEVRTLILNARSQRPRPSETHEQQHHPERVGAYGLQTPDDRSLFPRCGVDHSA